MKVTIDVENCVDCPHNDEDNREPDLCELKRSGTSSWYDWVTRRHGIPDWCPIKQNGYGTDE